MRRLKSVGRSRQRRSTAAAVVLVCVALVTAACGSTVPDAENRALAQARGGPNLGTPNSDFSGEGVTPDGSDPLGASSATGAGGNGAGQTGNSASGKSGGSVSAKPGASAPGVTADAVKVAFIGVNRDSAQATGGAAGAPTPDTGDPKAMAAAVRDWVNRNGGIAGHKMVEVVVTRDPGGNDPNAAEKQCAELTQDQKVFAVVGNNFEAPECYAKHKTLALHDSALSSAEMKQYSPYTWSPGLQPAEAAYAALVDSLIAQGWFAAGSKLGVIVRDNPAYRGMYQTQVKDRLARIGYKVAKEAFITDEDGTDQTAQYAAQVQGAATEWCRTGINRVIFMNPGGLAPILFFRAADSQVCHPLYGITSGDIPSLYLQPPVVPRSQSVNARGVGWVQGADVDSRKADPFPTGVAEKQCLEIMKATGDPPKRRIDALFREIFCDGALMLWAAGKKIQGPLTTASWAAAAEGLGAEFQSGWSLPDTTRFVPGRHFGGTAYRNVGFDTSCDCFAYTSGNKTFPL